MMPSKGHLDPTWVKVLIIDTGDVQACFITLDAIGMFMQWDYCNIMLPENNHMYI